MDANSNGLPSEVLKYLSYVLAALKIMMMAPSDEARLLARFREILTAKEYQAVITDADAQFDYGTAVLRNASTMNMAAIRQCLSAQSFSKYAVENFEQYAIEQFVLLPVRPDEESDTLYLPCPINLPYSVVAAQPATKSL
jgi:hypothetical protein